MGIENILNEIDNLRSGMDSELIGEISDGYHTFNELYSIRMAYNVALFNEWAQQKDATNSGLVDTKYNVHKSWKHYDDEYCFGGGWFVVVAKLPSGLVSNHYEEKYWDLFRVPEVPKSLFIFDGHNTEDVIERLINL